MPFLAGFRGLVVAGLMACALLIPSVPSRVAAQEASAALFPVAFMQIRSFMAPVSKPGAEKPHLRAVTLIVEVGEAETNNVCAFMPRVRDAVLVELFRQPIVVDMQAGMMVDGLEAQLVAPLNRALGKDAVRRVHVIPGSEAVAEEIASRLPMNRIIGCRPQRRGRA